MGYEANILKQVKKGAVYRHRVNGWFYLVTGFMRLQQGKTVEEHSDAVVFHRVEYISIPQNNPQYNKPKVGLRTTLLEQERKRVRRADDFMDNFFFHEAAEKRPSIVSIVNAEGDEVKLGKTALEGDLVVVE